MRCAAVYNASWRVTPSPSASKVAMASLICGGLWPWVQSGTCVHIHINTSMRWCGCAGRSGAREAQRRREHCGVHKHMRAGAGGAGRWFVGRGCAWCRWVGRWHCGVGAVTRASRDAGAGMEWGGGADTWPIIFSCAASFSASIARYPAGIALSIFLGVGVLAEGGAPAQMKLCGL